MGKDKAGLDFRGGRLVDAVASAVAAAAGSATLVGKPEFGGIADRYPGEGPLGGILTALLHTAAEWNLIVACDMPAVSAEFLRGLCDAAERTPADVLLPYGPDGRPEPLCAVYRRGAARGMQTNFARGVRKVTDGLEGLVIARLNVTQVSAFQNVNTPEEWAAYAAK
jgi:molybdopterin-guanine dinucleotide biosynthesis protein A